MHLIATRRRLGTSFCPEPSHGGWLITSTTVWHGGGTSRRRQRFALALLTVVTSIALLAGAIVAMVLTWVSPAAGGSPSSDSHATPVVHEVDTANDVEADVVEADTDQDIGADSSADATEGDVSDTASGPSEEPPAREEPTAPEDADAAEEPAEREEPEAVDEPTEADEPDAAEDAFTTIEQQRRLRELGFLIGPVDGRSGQQTTAAAMAFQQVNGLHVDGIVGPATKAALLEGSVEPSLIGGPADRIEVDLDAQLLHLIEGGERTVTLKASSGNGATYTSGGGGLARARTPVGQFVVERRIHGVREAALGTLYDPLYFYRGFAIHGSSSVPPYPASHGCVRVSRADAAWLIQRVADGMPVHLYGGSHVFSP